MLGLYDIALEYHEAGLRVIPFYKKADGTTTFPAWSEYREAQSREEVQRLFFVPDAEMLGQPFDQIPYSGIALICTDGIEAVDIDTKHDPAGTIEQEYLERVKTFEGGADLLKKCVIQRTKSGGLHLIYRASNAETNQKLTRRKEGKEAVIETRGPGKGLLFIFPSHGYSIEQGDLKAIPEITPEERNILINAARELDENGKADERFITGYNPIDFAANKNDANRIREFQGWNTSKATGGERPGDDFNRQHDVLDLLEGYGWQVSQRAGDIVRLSKPGATNPKDVHGSVLYTRSGERVFHPFTTATAYRPDSNYNAFAVYAIEEHNGDFAAAAKALRAKGYGSQEESTSKKADPEESGPATLYGLEENAEALVLIQDAQSADAAHEAGLPGVVAIDGPALAVKQISAALSAGTKRFTLICGNTAEAVQFTRQTVEILLRYQEAREAFFWVFVANIPAADLRALLGTPGGIETANKALAEAQSAAQFLANYFAEHRAPEIAREHTGGALDRDILRPYFKEELTQLWRLLPATETAYFEHLLSGVLDGYFLTWGEIKHDADRLREIEAEKRYRQEAAKSSATAAALFQEGKQEEAEEALREISAARIRAGAGKFTGLLETRTEEALRHHIQNAPPTLETSYRLEVDGRKMALKLPAGGLSFFAARPGHGKSRMLVNLALDICQHHGGEVHYFTYEESAEKVTLKALNAFADLDFGGHLFDTNEEALEAFFKADPEAIRADMAGNFESAKAGFFSLLQERRLNIHFSEMKAESLAEAIHYLHRRRNVSAVFVDYIQLLNLENPGRGINNRQEEVKAICNVLKDASRETGLPFVLAAQFNREVKSAEQMDMAALREAGDLEQTAALVVGMWNRFKDLENPAAELDARILKARHGAPTGKAIWQYNGNRYKVYPDTHTSAAPGGNSGATNFKLNG